MGCPAVLDGGNRLIPIRLTRTPWVALGVSFFSLPCSKHKEEGQPKGQRGQPGCPRQKIEYVVVIRGKDNRTTCSGTSVLGRNSALRTAQGRSDLQKPF